MFIEVSPYFLSFFLHYPDSGVEIEINAPLLSPESLPAEWREYLVTKSGKPSKKGGIFTLGSDPPTPLPKIEKKLLYEVAPSPKTFEQLFFTYGWGIQPL